MTHPKYYSYFKAIINYVGCTLTLKNQQPISISCLHLHRCALELQMKFQKSFYNFC